ncbi:unnamed protein product [Brassicogethes aeneus]|uniref:Uncharacterized protein n=1 Tax=Brassicogethes aeneus TaxID=1431903 RepID=A0A9P0AUR1_BRAAE|nr:unnamed protein product [Brassicogethes aeneus]
MKTDLKTDKGIPKENMVINVDISEEILTPLACASLVNEILKGLLYQKSQIPYPYTWMKTVVNRKRNNINDAQSANRNFSIENHFKVVSTAFDALEEIMSGIRDEFSSSSDVKEVIIVFGTNPLCPKEVFTIQVSDLAKGHIERNHVNKISQIQPKILRSIFLSQAWMDSVDGSAPCSNTFVYIKKETCESTSKIDTCFTPSRTTNFSDKVKQINIKLNFNKDIDRKDCCSNLMVFQEGDDSQSRHELVESENNEKIVVYCQSKCVVKGFKDCFINKTSASELW